MKKSGSLLRAMWPLAIIIVLAGAWSIYWYIASEKAKESFARYIEKNRRGGIEITCTDARWGGFPYQFTLNCSSLSAQGERGGIKLDFSGKAVRAVALAYSPFHLIVEVDGPFSFAGEDKAQSRTEVSSTGKPLRASLKLKLDPNRADQMSVEVKDQSGTITITGPGDGGATAPVPYTLSNVTIHSRFAAPPNGDNAPFDIAVSVQNLVYGPDQSTLFGTEPLRIETASIDANITALPFKPGLIFTERARRWQQGGGELTVRSLDSTSNFLTGASSGSLRLDNLGRLNGKLEWRVTGFDDLMARLLNAGLIDKSAATVADTILTVLGKPDENKPGLKLKTILKDGKLYFGPFKVSTIPPLYGTTE